jgi:phosphatidylserine/phosphatidylglycerophosphate/cardiolipin synthase-like enzyme
MKRLIVALLLVLPLSSLACDIQVAFSPDRGATEPVVKTIESARKTVRVAAYSFTSKPIAEALLADARRGVDVKVVVDKSQPTARYAAATFLANAGVPARVDYQYAIMHNKFIVVDGETVEEGSLNFAKAAQFDNAENVVVLKECPEVAARYTAEWQRRPQGTSNAKLACRLKARWFQESKLNLMETYDVECKVIRAVGGESDLVSLVIEPQAARR